VAPFYYDWPVELAALDAAGRLTSTWKTTWKLSGVQPDMPAATWRYQADWQRLRGDAYRLLLRVPNPLTNGLPLRFANQTQDQHLPGWLTLAEFARPDHPPNFVLNVLVHNVRQLLTQARILR
jgi:hypothetical protein